MPEYKREAIADAELDGVTETTAARIAGELDCSGIEKIKHDEDRDTYAVELKVYGGFFAWSFGTSMYGIRSVTGRGNPDTVTLTVVEKRH